MKSVNIPEVLLIIGNGFDLDLGLPTKYSDFVCNSNSEWLNLLEEYQKLYTKWFRNDTVSNSLLSHILESANKELWFDVEYEIFKYVSKYENPSKVLIGLVREQHESFKKHFCAFLRRIAVSTNVNQLSLAKNFLYRLTLSNSIVTICTFNYTDCFDLCGCKKREGIKILPIHGSLKTNRITLGCRARHGEKENQSFDFLYKSHDIPSNILHHYTNIASTTEIIVFGHSLNTMDASYFQSIFNTKRDEKFDRHLTIICKDNLSENCILKNMYDWSNASYMNKSWNIQFIHTNDFEKNKEKDLTIYDNLCMRLKI